MGGFGTLIPAYCGILKLKLNFHATHSQFAGNLSLDDFLRADRRLPFKTSSDIVQRCLGVGESILKLSEALFQLDHLQLTEVKVAVLIPLIPESYSLYNLQLTILNRMAAEATPDNQELGFLIKHFYEQYPRLRFLYEEAATIQYVTSVISVPTLSRIPPEISFKRPEKPTPAPAPAPVPVVPQAVAPAPAPTTYVAPVPTPDLFGQHHFVPMTYQPQPQPQPQTFQFTNSFASAAGNPGNSQWVTFTPGPTPLSAGWPSSAPAPSPLSTTLLSMSTSTNLFPEPTIVTPVPISIPEPVTFIPPEPQTVPPSTIASPRGNAELDPSKPQIPYDDLKNRFTQLQLLFKKERARNQELEAALTASQEATRQWQARYERLEAEHRELRTAHGALLDSQQNLEERLIELERVAETERRRQALGQLDAAKANLDRALLSLVGGAKTAISDDPQELLQNAAAISDALSRFHSATTTEERMAAIAQLSQSVEHLLQQVAAVGGKIDDPTLRTQLREAGEIVGRELGVLLENAQIAPKDVHGLESAAHRVKTGLDMLAEVARSVATIMNTEPSDELADSATRELLQAAAVIDQAARSLEATKAMEKPKLSVADTAISDAIIDAAIAIATATKRLVSQATSVQKENVAQGRARGASSNWYLKNAKWSQGLISASKSVAEGTSMLVHAANETAFGRIQEEALVASSMSVSASTAQLVAAARVRGDPHSAMQQGLEVAAKAVSQSTANLVSAAKSVTARAEQEEEQLDFGGSMVQKMRAQQEAQMKVLELQRQLEQAQTRLFRLNQAQYSGAGGP